MAAGRDGDDGCALTNAEPVLLDPPDWPGLGNDQLTVFVESVNSLLDFGIFRPPLATGLAAYRDAAGDEISARIAGSRTRDAPRPPAAAAPDGPRPGTFPAPGHIQETRRKDAP
jgi:hypothetical protein